jgi:hypothetical protein
VKWWFFEQRAYPSGIIPADARLRALQQIEQSRSTQIGTDDSATSAAPEPKDGPTWAAPILRDRRTRPRRQLAESPTSPLTPETIDHWLIGAAQGGIWETRDAGKHLDCSKRRSGLARHGGDCVRSQRSQDCLCRDLARPAFTSIAYGGVGVLKVRRCWRHLAISVLECGDGFLRPGSAISRWIPANPDVVIAATLGANGAGCGIMKSTDGRFTWSRKMSATPRIWKSIQGTSPANTQL